MRNRRCLGSLDCNVLLQHDRAKMAKKKPAKKTARKTARKAVGRRSNKNGVRNGKEWEPEPRDLEMYAMVVEGVKTFDEIGKEFNLHKSNVSRISKKIDKWLTPQWMDDIRSIKSRHTENLFHIFQQAMRSWEDSKCDEVTVKTEEITVGDEGLPGEKTTTTTKQNKVGNPAFLSQARAALQDIRKIWGADEPIEHRHSGDIRVAGMSRTEMHQRLAEHYQSMVKTSEN